MWFYISACLFWEGTLFCFASWRILCFKEIRQRNLVQRMEQGKNERQDEEVNPDVQDNSCCSIPISMGYPDFLKVIVRLECWAVIFSIFMAKRYHSISGKAGYVCIWLEEINGVSGFSGKILEHPLFVCYIISRTRI